MKLNLEDMFSGMVFSQDYINAALMVSLLSVWVLVGLFFYLNRYTRREYFTIWTAAWLFYALWLTLSLHGGNSAATSTTDVKAATDAKSLVSITGGSAAATSPTDVKTTTDMKSIISIIK